MLGRHLPKPLLTALCDEQARLRHANRRLWPIRARGLELNRRDLGRHAVTAPTSGSCSSTSWLMFLSEADAALPGLLNETSLRAVVAHLKNDGTTDGQSGKPAKSEALMARCRL